MALILTRKINESFYIGDDIKVTVSGVGTQTQLSISAPKEVIILREELCSPDDWDNKENIIESNR